MCGAVTAFRHTSKFRDFHLTLLPVPPGLTLQIILFLPTLYICILYGPQNIIVMFLKG